MLVRARQAAYKGSRHTRGKMRETVEWWHDRESEWTLDASNRRSCDGRGLSHSYSCINGGLGRPGPPELCCDWHVCVCTCARVNWCEVVCLRSRMVQRAKLDAATVLAAIGARDSSAAARLDRVRKSLQHIEDGLEVAEATPLRGDRRRRRMKAALFRAPSAISEDVSKFARETSAQQRRYNSVVAREEAQNEVRIEMLNRALLVGVPS